ncbi:MAG: DNA polymerase III subunit gamma/tau, partial [Verrucomicrobiota bacterium]|nr:DNA polymerase III subunit gamma/tau [Verrucomicrobiota bacterium]
LLIYQVSRGDLKVLEVSEAEAAALKEHSSALSAETLTRIMEVLTEGERRLREAASKKILIEVTLLKAIQARQAVSIDAVLKQLQELRAENSANFSAPKQITENIPVHRTIAPTPMAAPISQNVTADTPISEIPSADLETLWRQLLEAVGRASAFMRSYLLEAHPVSFAKNILTIGFDSEFADHISLVDNARNHTLLQTKLQELGHPDSQIKFIKSEGNRAGLSIESLLTPPTGSPTLTKSEAPKTAETIRPAAKSSSESDQSNKENFKNDPLIQKALEIFKGQIVEVRS